MSAVATPVAARPPATLSLDLDNLWCYQRSFGVQTWRSYPTFLGVALPRILGLLATLDLRITVFVIGRDAADPAHQPLLAEAARMGHEIGNHSHDHDLDLHRWPRERIRQDLLHAAQAIEAATGQRPRGFRAPAYSLSRDLLDVLCDLGYRYDASGYPNSVGALARLYPRLQASRLGQEVTVREGLYGSFRDCGRPLTPYRWSLAAGELTEVPVTTLPLLRLPFHGTYLNHLADSSPAVAERYLRVALALCRLRGVAPSLLLHATDFLGRDDTGELSYLPGMKRSGAEKTAFMTKVLRDYKATFEVQTVGAYAEEMRSSRSLPRLAPVFST